LCVSKILLPEEVYGSFIDYRTALQKPARIAEDGPLRVLERPQHSLDLGRLPLPLLNLHHGHGISRIRLEAIHIIPSKDINTILVDGHGEAIIQYFRLLGDDLGAGADHRPAVVVRVVDFDVFVDVVELVQAAETVDVAG
jgi:hypothetical protein